MNDLEIWVMLGKGRISALARYMGVSRQYVGKNISRLCKDEVLMAMNKVEQYEMNVERCIKNNIVCSAMKMSDLDKRVREFARHSFTAWSEIHNNLKLNS